MCICLSHSGNHTIRPRSELSIFLSLFQPLSLFFSIFLQNYLFPSSTPLTHHPVPFVLIRKKTCVCDMINNVELQFCPNRLEKQRATFIGLLRFDFDQSKTVCVMTGETLCLTLNARCDCIYFLSFSFPLYDFDKCVCVCVFR